MISNCDGVHHNIEGFVFKASKGSGTCIVFHLQQLYLLWMMHLCTGLLNKLKLKVDNTPLHCRLSNCCCWCEGYEWGICLCFIILYLLFLHFLSKPPSAHKLLQVTVNIRHMQQRTSPLASLLPFFYRSLRPSVWVGLSGTVTSCRNCGHESLMGIHIT